MKILDKEQIKNILPHRAPILLADSAETETDGSITTTFFADPGMKIFEGHFPDEPVLPGVCVIEAMAQCAGLLLLCKESASGSKPYLASVERMRFIRPVLPGDTLTCHAQLSEADGTFYSFTVSAEVNSKAVAKGVLALTLK